MFLGLWEPSLRSIRRNYIQNLPTNQDGICWLLVQSTEMVFSIHFSATKVPTPPKPELLPDHKNLYLQCLPIIIHAEQPVLRVSWNVQMLVIFLARASTTSQGLPCMVPTFRDAICSLNLFCRISHDIDLTGPTWTPTLPLTAPHQVLVLLFF